MLKNLRDSIIGFISSRMFVLIVVFLVMGGTLLYRLFDLQIVHGQEYLDEFTLTIRKERTISSTRGQIYDRNGNLLAYNELAYSVTIEDVYESGRGKNEAINTTLNKLIDMIEKNGDYVDNDFDIIINQNGDYAFAVDGSSLLRFLADIYGERYVDDLTYAQKTSTADDVMNYLFSTSKFGIGEYETPGVYRSTFYPGRGFSKKRALQIATIRYEMSLNSYQKYIPTVISTDVSDETVAMVLENSNDLQGVAIAEDTVRKYVDPQYFSHIIGYTGKIDQTEYAELSQQNDNYELTDVIGKSGIESYMESYLQGIKGSEIVYVNNLGKVIETSDRVEPRAGNDLYLTIDMNLQKAVYNLLEQKIAGILISRIRNVKEYEQPENASASNIIIPIDDVYYALINNSVIDINRFSDDHASDTERNVYSKYTVKRDNVFDNIRAQLNDGSTPYRDLDTEYKVYQSFIVNLLTSDGVIVSSSINPDDATYKAWKEEESISLKSYLMHTIAMNWIDINKLSLDDKYMDSESVYNALVEYIFSRLTNNTEFKKKVYRYMISDNSLTGKEICTILFDQGVITGRAAERSALENGAIAPYDFMVSKISNLEITPAQLALDPCSGSVVVTDVNTGEVRALVTYPGYDNNRLANSVDNDYYARLNSDLSKPLWNYATQQTSAPGSTFKMVTATAALEEHVVGYEERVKCTGIWEVLEETHPPKCWIYPAAHGELNVIGGIENSCNYFFYEMGYRLGCENGLYDSELGLSKLYKYADMYGLSDKSGIEIAEAEPEVSDMDSVRSAIGQGTNNYTTVGLARYVNTVANSGKCFNLSLIDRVTDSSGDTIEDFTPSLRNTVEIDQSTWNAIHAGMRRVVLSKKYYENFGVSVAGKTGTAQESKSRPNHALFVSYAPYENPEISVATRIAFGYASDYAAQLTQDVYKYYFHLEDVNSLIDGTASATNANVSNEE